MRALHLEAVIAERRGDFRGRMNIVFDNQHSCHGVHLRSIAPSYI
jgi:hypothetical protein